MQRLSEAMSPNAPSELALGAQDKTIGFGGY
jgi:hypothetical protein